MENIRYSKISGHDFSGTDIVKVYPYGIYDIAKTMAVLS
jgi:hypothetical protein